MITKTVDDISDKNPFYFWEEREIYEKYNSIEEAIDHILNSRKEKSIRRAFYRHYDEIISNHLWFSAKADYIITRVFSDTNFITFLLSSYNKKEFFYEYKVENVLRCFEWLYQYYNEKEIIQMLFSKLRKGDRILTMRKSNGKDLLKMLDRLLEEKSISPDLFKRVPVKKLHDTLSFYINYKMPSNKCTYKYKEANLKKETNIKGLTFMLPNTNFELHDWAREMANCMFIKDSEIQDNSTAVYGVFKEGKLTYAVEIKNHIIAEAKAKHNKNIPDFDFATIELWAQN